MLRTFLSVEVPAGWVTEWPELVIPADSFWRPKDLYQRMVDQILKENGHDDSVGQMDAGKVQGLGRRIWVSPRQFFEEDWDATGVSGTWKQGWIEVVVAELYDEKFHKEGV